MFGTNLPNKYAAYIFGIHQTIYAALASWTTEQMSQLIVWKLWIYYLYLFTQNIQ